jgi:hypothetical protein
MVYHHLSFRFSLRLVLRVAANTHRMRRVRVETKNEVLSRRGHEDPEGEQRYSSILSLTSVLDGVSVQRLTPAALPPGKRAGTHCIGGCGSSTNNPIHRRSTKRTRWLKSGDAKRNTLIFEYQMTFALPCITLGQTDGVL